VVASVQGLDLESREGRPELVLQERMKVRQHRNF
jgi:hypothetical protein